MNKLTDKNDYLTLGILFTLTIAIAIVGIAAEVVFVANHLEHIAREMSLLTIGKIPN